jgi:hypothetical protein
MENGTGTWNPFQGAFMSTIPPALRATYLSTYQRLFYHFWKKEGKRMKTHNSYLLWAVISFPILSPWEPFHNNS